MQKNDNIAFDNNKIIFLDAWCIWITYRCSQHKQSFFAKSKFKA